MKVDVPDSNNKDCGDLLLKSIHMLVSKKIVTTAKLGWIKKDDKLPMVTITKAMDEVQKSEKTKILSIDFTVWANDKKSRNSITANLFTIVRHIDFGKYAPEISGIIPIEFEENRGIYRCQFSLVFYLKIKLPKKELEIIKDRLKKLNTLKRLFPDVTVFDDYIEAPNKTCVLVHAKKETRKDILALVKENRMLWKMKFDNLVHFSLADNCSYCIAVTQLKETEMPSGYNSGGHVYIISAEGLLKDIKLPCDGLSCSISSNTNYFGVTTMGPEWGVYYFTNKGKLLWKKKFDKRIGGIELIKDQVILYNKLNKETRKIIIRLNRNGERI